MAKKKSDKLKIMVSSMVYHFKPELEQPCATLTGYGYGVSNSHLTSPRITFNYIYISHTEKINMKTLY